MSVECKANPRRIQGESKANPRRIQGETQERGRRLGGDSLEGKQGEAKKRTRRDARAGVGPDREQGEE